MSKKTFQFRAFLDESLLLLSNPEKYFRQLPLSGGYARPLLRALLYSIFAGILAFILNILEIYDGGMMPFMDNGVRALIPVWYIIGSIIVLMLGTGIMIASSALCRGRTDFETAMRLASSLMILLPVSTLLGISFGLGHRFGALVSLLVNLYGLYLVYNALVFSMGGRRKTAVILVLVLGLFFLISSILHFSEKGRSKVAFPVSILQRTKFPEQTKEYIFQSIPDLGSFEADEEDSLIFSMTIEDLFKAHDGFTVYLSSGEHLENPSLMDLRKALGKLGSDNKPLELSNGDLRIRVEKRTDGFYTEYRDREQRMLASSSHSRLETFLLFEDFINGKKNWHERFLWELQPDTLAK